MTQSLAQDRPTIDAAIKSYISLTCAKALTASATDDVVMGEAAAESTTSTIPLDQASKTTLLGFIPSSGLARNSTSTGTTNNATSDATVTNNNKTGGSVQQHVLQLARIILQTLNQYTFPIHCTVANETAQKPGLSQNQQYILLELSIASQLWNGLVQSKQKPSRFFGRKALKHAWKHQLGDEILTKLKSTTTTTTSSISPDVLQQQQQQQQQLQWLSEFEKLLFSEAIEVSAGTATDLDQDDDSALLWAADGGTAELAKRRTRRQQAATKRETTNTTAATDTTTMNTIAE